MAGNLPVPNGVEVKLVWARAGVPFALNILHFSHAPLVSHTQARADTIATSYLSALTSSGHGASIHTTVSLLRVESRHMDSNSDPWFIGAPAPVSGTGATDLLPLANSLVITLKTGLRGRSFNGRVYLAGFVETVNDAAGQCTSAAATAAVNFIASAQSANETALQLDGAVLSRFTTPPTAPPGTPATERNPPILTSITNIVNLDLRWDVQRRRARPGI